MAIELMELSNERTVCQMSIGEKLRNLRLSASRTLKQQSEILGVSLNTVYRWEHDLIIPKLSVLKQMADCYNVTYEWLLNEGSAESIIKPVSNLNGATVIEYQLLRMFRQLSVDKKNKVLGYLERMYVECNTPNS